MNSGEIEMGSTSMKGKKSNEDEDEFSLGYRDEYDDDDDDIMAWTKFLASSRSIFDLQSSGPKAKKWEELGNKTKKQREGCA